MTAHYQRLADCHDEEDGEIMPLADFLAIQLGSVDEIYAEVRQVQLAKLDEEKRHRKTMTSFSRRVTVARTKCCHYLVQDEHCEICGAKV